MARVSVLIPCYNGEKYLTEALRSASEQSYRDIEIIAVDNRSTDATAQIIKEEAERDKRIIYVEEKRRGISFALNSGLCHCNGEFIARLDADDMMDRRRIAKQLQILEEIKDLTVVGSSISVCGKEGRISRRVSFPRKHIAIVHGLEEGRWVVAHPTVTFRREAICRVGGYFSEYQHAEDLELWLRLAREGSKFVNMAEPLTVFRSHGENDTYINSKKQAIARMQAIESHYRIKVSERRTRVVYSCGFMKKGGYLEETCDRLANSKRSSCKDREIRRMLYREGYYVQNWIFAFLKKMIWTRPLKCVKIVTRVVRDDVRVLPRYVFYFLAHVWPVQVRNKFRWLREVNKDE